VIGSCDGLVYAVPGHDRLRLLREAFRARPVRLIANLCLAVYPTLVQDSLFFELSG
jgi:hypothetical protein